MDPLTIAELFKSGSGLIKSLSGPGVTTAPPPPQRADGYALGGMIDSASPNAMSSGATGGATGGAYGGAYSQSMLDGSNWVVSTGKSNAVGGGTSGAKPIFSPAQSTSQGGVAPASPFSFGAGAGMAAAGAGTQAISSTTMLLVAAVVILIWKR